MRFLGALASVVSREVMVVYLTGKGKLSALWGRQAPNTTAVISGLALMRAPEDEASAAIPDRSDGRPGVARAETAAIVVSAVKAGTAVIVPLAIIAEILG